MIFRLHLLRATCKTQGSLWGGFVDVEIDSTSLLATLKSFGLSSFSTKQFIDRYKSLYPQQWKAVEAAHGKGGKGAGKFYSSFSRMSQALNTLSKRGELVSLIIEPRHLDGVAR